MIKYSFEFKNKVVTGYLEGEGEFQYFSKMYGLRSNSQFERGIVAFREYGNDGLRCSRKSKFFAVFTLPNAHYVTPCFSHPLVIVFRVRYYDALL